MATCLITYKNNNYTEEELIKYIQQNPSEFQDYFPQENIFLQEEKSPTPSKASPFTIEKIHEFLDRIRVDVKRVNQIVVNGQIIGANGVADPLNSLIQVVNGKEDTVLPEEAMHIAVEILEQTNPVIFGQMLGKIGTYGQYKDILRIYRDNPQYQKDGKPDIRKIKKETIARVLVETIINKNEGSTEKPELLAQTTSWWQQILDWLKTLFTKPGFNPFEEAAIQIIEGDIGTTEDIVRKGQFLSRNENQVNATMKVVQALRSPKIEQIYNRFYANNKDKFYAELNQLAPKEQVAILKDWNSKNNPESLDEMITGVLSQLSYTVEIQTATKPDVSGRVYDGLGGFVEMPSDVPSDYYSNLTVPGGTNYRENEIRTPSITPSIKGHAQFATDQGIGWFRSDERGVDKFFDTEDRKNITFSYWLEKIKGIKGKNSDEVFEYRKQYGKEFEDFVNSSENISYSSKTRRILELQSDLFQKGRESIYLTDESRDAIEEPQRFPVSNMEEELNKNNFLQLLNKDNNWVKFFVQSIVQDSAKKGYAKVLFPAGETAAKIEGHEILANEIIKINEEIELLERSLSTPGRKAEFITIDMDTLESLEERKQELKTQGVEKLKPIEGFYEVRVKNILDKIYGKKVSRITDEHGNDWFEVSIDQDRDLGEFYFQIDNTAKEKSFVGKLEKMESQLSKDINKAGKQVYYINGKEIANRVSDKVDAYYRKIFKNKSIEKEEWQKAIDEFRQDKGTDGHLDMEDIFHRYVDDEGYLRKDPLPQTNPSQLEPNNNSLYKTLEDNIVARLNSYPVGTKFLSETMMYDEKNDEGATVDFMAIIPDDKIGFKVDVLDWKFIDFNPDKSKDVPWYKQGAWNIQMAEYKRILKDQYGLKEDNFRQTVMIPIRADYAYIDPKDRTKGLKLRAVRIGNVDVKKINDDYLLPVALPEQTTGNEEVDAFIKQLNGLATLEKNKPAQKGREFAKSQKINQILSAIRKLQVKGDVNELAEQGLALVSEQQSFLERYKQLKNKELSRDEESEISEQLINSYNSLEIYRDIDVLFGRVLNKNNEEDKKILVKLQRLSSNARLFEKDVKKAVSGFTNDVIATGVAIQDFWKPEKVVTYLKKMFRSFSQGETKAAQVLYKIIQPIQQKLNIEAEDELKKNKQLDENLFEWAKAKGYSQKEIFKVLYKEDNKGKFSGDFIDQISQKFYEEFNKKALIGDTKWFQENTKIDEYREWFEGYKKERLDYINDRAYYEDPILNKERKKSEITAFEKEFDIEKYPSAYNNFKMKQLAKDKWYSDEYKFLNEKGNEPALAAFNYFQEINKKAYKLGILNAWQWRTFVPNVRSSLAETIVMGQIRNPGKSFIDSVTVQSDDTLFGAMDPLTNKPIDKIPVAYLNDLGSVSIDKEGKEYIDYSDKSTDLFKVYQLFSDQVRKYEYLSEVEPKVKLLKLAESLKSSYRTNQWGKIMRKEGKAELIGDNRTNTDYLDKFIQYYVYGKKVTEDDQFDIKFQVGDKSVSLAKSIEQANRWFSMKVLGLNLPTSISNLLGGNFHILIKSGKLFTNKEFLKNELLISSSRWSGESGKKLAGLMDYLVPLTDDQKNEWANKRSVTKMSEYLTSDFMFTLQRHGDKAVQYAIALSMMENTMVDNGKLLNIREYVRSKNGYENIYNLSKSERDLLNSKIEKEINELKESSSIVKIATIKKDEIEIPGVERTSDSVLSFRNQVQQISKDALGGLSEEDRMQVSMTLLGRSIMMFKNWIPRLVDQRVSELRYNVGSDSYEWGRMRMVGRLLFTDISHSITNLREVLTDSDKGIEFIKRLYEIKKQTFEENTGQEFKMTEQQFIDMYKAGIKAQMKELAFLISLLSLFFSLKANAPDKDEPDEIKGMWKWSVNMLDRVSDELAFFYSPRALTQIANGSILPSLGLLTDIQKIVTHTSKELFGIATGNEEIEKGAHPVKYLFKAFPITRQMDAYLSILDKELADEMGIQLSTESRTR